MAETLSNGVVIPQGTDLIHGSGVQAMRNLGGSVNTALSGRSAVGHSHIPADVEGLTAALAKLEEATYFSGVRDISGLLNAGFTAFQVYLLRYGNVVTLHVVNLAYSGAATGTVSVFNMPVNFRPSANASGYTSRGQLAVVTGGGVMQVANPTASVTSVAFTFLTTRNPPSEPPGEAV